MTHRVLTALMMMVVLGAVPVASQTTTPMTSWGDPDLQGVWTDPYATNLQRHPSLGEREFYSEEEVAELDQRRIDSQQRPRAAQGSIADVAGAYDGLYISMRPTGRRTSLIVDPPDGQLPALTPMIQQRRAAMRGGIGFNIGACPCFGFRPFALV